MENKGQAAMEFFMTYGWAIFVVLAAIGMLAYFGVLNPDSFRPDYCYCKNIDMFENSRMTQNNITYIECFDTEPYMDYDNERIRFVTEYRLFYCDENKTLVPV